MKCEICGKECSNKGINNHIRRKHNISIEDYYIKYIGNPSYCPICGNKTEFLGIVSGYRTCCSKSCASKYGLKAALETNGVTNISQIPAVKEKMRKSIKHSWDTLTEKEREQRKENITNGTREAMKDWVIEKQDLIAQFEKDNKCTRQTFLIDKYGTGWLQAGIISNKNKLYYLANFFIMNSDISLIENYTPKISIRCTSNKEKALVEHIKSIYSGSIIENTRKLIPPYELDIYIPDKKLAIEFNGLYWHNDKNKPKNYHLEKSKLCEKVGIRLIHIYEWELEEPQWSKIKMVLNQALGNNPTIYARNCEIREITNQEAKDFNNKNHLQGHRNAQITYGLFYQGELVQLMSFSKTRYNRNLKSDNEWEIIRGCPGSNNIVIGGVSKLFKYFIKMHNPNKIFSYCDFNKFDGRSYEIIGMKCIGYTGPDKTWIIGDMPVKRNPKKYRELKEKSDSIVWGSGSKKYVWEDTD